MSLTARLLRFVGVAVLVVLVSAAGVGCSGSKHRSGARSPRGGIGQTRDLWGTIWLCRPGAIDDPCTSDLATTMVGTNGAGQIVRTVPARSPRVDCFYVYPTISGEATVNADLQIDFRLREIAIAQASRFSQVCSVYAPVYRQITLAALEHPGRVTRADALIAYRSVLSAFQDYLAHYNDGRGIVFIGHSQGAAILIKLLRARVDDKPALRDRLVSALLLGGNVTVAKGRATGGDFAHIPACRSSRQSGCVVAYSSFVGKPPRKSAFARTTSDAGLSLLAPKRTRRNLQILCVNPASPGGGEAPLEPAVPSLVLAFLPAHTRRQVNTPWVAFPDQYSARCQSAGNATWLQITHTAGTGPQLTHLRDPALGLHILDVNIALNNLVRLVRDEAGAYEANAH